MKNKKYKIIGFSSLGIAGSAIALGITLPIVLEQKDEQLINLFGQNFKNRESIIEYALNNLNKADTEDGYWVLDKENNKKFLKYSDLRKYLSKNISTIQSQNFEDLNKKGIFNSDNSLSQTALDDILVSNTSSSKRFFRGVNDTIFDNKKDAIHSYFQYHKIYSYNGITFRTTEDLKRYLFDNYDSLNTFNVVKSKKNIEAPSGIKSNFFDLLGSKQDKEEAREFIANTATNLLGFKNKSANNSYDYINVNDIINNHLNNNFWNNLNLRNLNAIHIKSNGGKATWITDSMKEDSANFYGKYFTKSKTNEISFIEDAQKWEETNDAMDTSFLKQSRNASLVGNFFNIMNRLVAYADVDLKNKDEVKKLGEINSIFDVPKYQKILGNITKKYNSENLKRIISELKQKSKILSGGKRYNPLYEVPLLYLYSLSHAETFKMKNKELKLLKEFFGSIMDDFQEVLETVLPPSALFDSDNNKINLKYLFGINDSSQDLNATPESAMYKLSESSKFMEGIDFYKKAITNRISNGGMQAFYTSGISNTGDYNALWEIFRGDTSEYQESDSLNKIKEHLGRKISNAKAKRLLKIVKVNYSLYEANETIMQKANLDNFVKNLDDLNIHDTKTLFTYLSISKPEYNDEKFGYTKKLKFLEENMEFLLKQQKIEDVKKMNLKDIKKEVGSIKLKERFISGFKKQIQNNQKLSLGIKNRIYKDLDFNNINDKQEKYKQRVAKAKKITKALQGVQGAISVVVDANNLAEQIKNNDAYGALKTVASLLGTASEFLAAFPVAGASLQILSFATDVIAEVIGKDVQNFYRFNTSEDESNKFYWDGGHVKSHLWGLWNEQKSSKKDMEICEPIKIWNGAVKDYWYYNGMKYTDVSELKKQALLDYAKGDEDALIFNIANPSIKRGFTYSKIKADHSLKKGAMVYGTREELAKKLVPKNINKKFISEHNSYFKDSEVRLIGGKIAQVSNLEPGVVGDQLKKENIKGLLEQIQPIVVVQMPKTINNIPKDQFTNSQDDYKLPGNKIYSSWKIQENKNYNSSRYLMVNMNELAPINNSKNKISILKRNTKYASIKDVLPQLEKTFINNLDVKSIYTLQSNNIYNNRFSELKTTKHFFLYKATGIAGQKKYFAEYLDAFKWLISKKQLNLKMITSKSSSEKIIFKEKVYNNVSELIKYLDKLIIDKGAKHE